MGKLEWSTGSTTDDFWSASETYRQQKQNNGITSCWTLQPWPLNLNEIATGKPGAVHLVRWTAASQPSDNSGAVNFAVALISRNFKQCPHRETD